MTIGGPTVIAATDGRRQRSNHQPGPGPTSRLASSPETAEEPQSPLPQHKDDAPVFRSSNDSRMRNRCPVNRPSRRINSLAGHATPLAGEAGAVLSPHDDHLKKGAPCCLNLYPFSFFSLSLSLAIGIEKRGYFERILLSEGSGPRALLLIRGSKVAPCGVQQPPQSTRAPSPLLIRGSKASPSEGFDSRPRARRVRNDPRYVCYMTKARAALPRYPRTFPRPAGTMCNGIPSEGGTEPSDPIKWVWVQQITCRYFWSAPLGH
jgi:hypothetical protein